VSEADFVANFLLPELKKSSKALGFDKILDFHVEDPVKMGIGKGWCDLTIGMGGKHLLVIEAKFKKKVGKNEIDIEPRDPDVIDQVVNYAVSGGYKFYATCNINRLVLFKFIPGKKIYECEIDSFEFEKNSKWKTDCINYALEKIKPKPKPVDDTLVDTLHEAFHDLYPEFLSSLNKKLKDKQFKKDYTEWLANQGLELIEEKNKLIASQTTYLQINKLMFYKVIRSLFPNDLPKLKIKDGQDISKTLTNFYKKIKKIDYKPIYETSIISEIPLTRKAEIRFMTLIDTLLDFDFTTVESDFLGTIYEKLIPPNERKLLGQFYTPPPIVDFILGLTLKNKDSILLDPACGSGTFLVKAYHRLKKLNGFIKNFNGPHGGNYHKKLLKQIYGLDINQFPAHLSVINLAIQKPKTKIDTINVIVKDAFDIIAGQATLSGFQSIDTKGKPTELEIPSSFDVIVANPPYIRQEKLGTKEKEKIKARIEWAYKDKVFLGKPGKIIQKKKKSVPTKRHRNVIIVSKKSDIYVYFYIQALNLLKENGKLGFISSNKWLEVEYGESFQKFLLEYCKILYIIEFDSSIFPDADVNTAIVILEKETKKENRDNNLVTFARFKTSLPVDSMLKSLKNANKNIDNSNLKIRIIKQGKLTLGKWSIHLRAPPIFYKIVSHSKITPLNSVAHVEYAIKTGYNEYFVLPNQKAKSLKIEKGYLKPCLSSPKEIDELIITPSKIKNQMFMIWKDKFYLKNTNALTYLKYGESLKLPVTRGSKKGTQKLTERESIKGHNPYWYCLPKLSPPPILFQYIIDVRGWAFWNKIGAHATDNFHYVIPNKKKDVLPLLAILNSTLTLLMGEFFGRSYGGGVLKIQKYELDSLPILDPSQLDEPERKKLSSKFINLADIISQNKNNEKLISKAQKELDDEVFSCLDLSKKDRLAVINGVTEQQKIRESRKET